MGTKVLLTTKIHVYIHTCLYNYYRSVQLHYICVHVATLWHYIYARASSYIRLYGYQVLITEHIVQRVSKTAMSTYYNNAEQIMQAIGNSVKACKDVPCAIAIAICVPSCMDCHKRSFKYLIPYIELLLGGLYKVFMSMRTAKKPCMVDKTWEQKVMMDLTTWNLLA